MYDNPTEACKKLWKCYPRTDRVRGKRDDKIILNKTCAALLTSGRVSDDWAHCSCRSSYLCCCYICIGFYFGFCPWDCDSFCLSPGSDSSSGSCCCSCCCPGTETSCLAILGGGDTCLVDTHLTSLQLDTVSVSLYLSLFVLK